MRLLLLYVLFFTNIIYLKYPNFPFTGACYTDRSFATSIDNVYFMYQTMDSRKFATLLQTEH